MTLIGVVFQRVAAAVILVGGALFLLGGLLAWREIGSVFLLTLVPLGAAAVAWRVAPPKEVG